MDQHILFETAFLVVWLFFVGSVAFDMIGTMAGV